MSAPRVTSITPGSPAEQAGLQVGDVVVAVEGEVPRDVIRYRLLVDDADPEMTIERSGLERDLVVAKRAGEALGAQVDSPLFDQIRTCDNHCEFCFIYQLPKGMRPSLYVKDDDYRLSFLYGNFTTLTRFTEADLERVVTEGLSPLHVSIHTTDRELRSRMLKNRRGATSLRWLRVLLDHGIEIHGQVVVCPGVNDATHLERTLLGVLDEFPELATLCVVPLGVSRYSTEASMRAHTRAEAAAVVDLVEAWQEIYRTALGRRLAYAADEYYLLAGTPFPPAHTYEGFPMHEDGVGMARAFEAEFHGEMAQPVVAASGFFASIDGAPAAGYRAPRGPLSIGPRRDSPVAVLTGELGAPVLEPLLADCGARVVTVDNQFFGGNIGVTGLLVGADLARVLADQPVGHRYLLADVCLSEGRFLDDLTPADLPRPVDVVATDGRSLRQAIGA